MKFLILILFLLYQKVFAFDFNAHPCGKSTHSGATGVLQPKDNIIKAGTTCEWTINPKRGEIYLYFVMYELPSTDEFIIKNDSDKGNILFGPFNGTIKSNSILTGVKSVYVSLKCNTPSGCYFKAKYDSQICSEDLQDNFGVIKSPIFSAGRTDIVKCSWRFNQSVTEYIAFKTFTISSSTVDITGTKNADGSYTKGKNPPDLLGEQFPNVNLALNTASMNEFFEFIYSPYTESCSNTITLTADKPNFSLNNPLIHDQEYNCKWIVNSPVNSTITLLFKTISLTEADIFQINDGSTQFSTELGIFSQKDSKSLINKSFASTQNAMWVSFSSQPFLINSFFDIQLSITKKDNLQSSECHKLYTEPVGEIKELITDKCELTFAISKTELLHLNFDKLELKNLEDIAIISDLNDSRDTFEHFSRHDLPESMIISSAHNVTLEITVNRETHLEITYSNKCKCDLLQSGLVNSPLYLPLSTNNIFCNYNFKLDSNYKLEFDSYNLNRSHIEIEDNNHSFKKCFDDDYLPEDMILPSNSTLKFFISALKPEEFVTFKYHTINHNCNKTVFLDQKISYDLHINKDSIFETCWISISAPRNQPVEVLIREIQDTSINFYDASKHLFEINSTENSQSVRKTIDTSHNPLTVFITPSTNLTIDASFWIKTADNSLCGKKNHNHTRGKFQPANEEMTPSSECAWNLAPDGTPQQIYLFINTHLQPKDELIIYEYNNLANILFKYTDGITSPFSILTGRTSVSLSVKTLKGAVRPFSALFDSVICGQNITENYGFYVSPIYKLGNDTITCQWNFLEDGLYQLVFNNWKLESNLSSISLNEKTYDSFPGDLFFSKNAVLKVTLDLQTPDETISFSFLRSSDECSKQLDLSVKPEPLHFPSLAYNPYYCNYILSAPTGNKIGLNFTNFNIDANTFFVVSDGASEINTTLMVVTNINQQNMINRIVRSTKNELRIQMKSSLLLPKSSIMAAAFIDQHGGYFNQPTNFSIYPQAAYLLEVDEQSQVRLNILSEFPKDSCLEILSDFYTNSPLIRKICSKNDSPVVSPTNKMTILPSYKGSTPLEANFTAIPKGCISISTGESGTYSLVGSSPVDCSWGISSHDNAVIILLFTLVKTTGEIYTQEGDLISKLEANMPLLYIPGGMGVRITMETKNVPKTELVIQAHYDIMEKCLTTFENFSHIQVSSPNYPNAYPLFANCLTNFSVKENLYFSFKLLDLAPGHELTIFDGAKVWKTFTRDSSIERDFILSSKASLLFKSGVCKPGNCALKSLASHSGYVLEVTKLTGGFESNLTKGSISTAGQLKAPFAYMWIINIPIDGMLDFDLDWTSGNGTVAGFNIYDGNSIKVNPFTNLTGNNLLSRSPTIVVTYVNLINSPEKFPDFKLSYADRPCIVRCVNHFCMHEDWVCNDINDCGDWTDERNCNATWPNPPVSCDPKQWTLGVGIGVPLTFFLGIILGLVLIPLLVAKYKLWREDAQYRELTVSGFD